MYGVRPVLDLTVKKVRIEKVKADPLPKQKETPELPKGQQSLTAGFHIHNNTRQVDELEYKYHVSRFNKEPVSQGQ